MTDSSSVTRTSAPGRGYAFVRPPLVIAATSALIALAYGTPRLGYDALFALVWGRQVYRLEAPSLVAANAPTPHPLANLVGALLGPLGANTASSVLEILACVGFATAGYAAWLIGSRLIGPACGVLFTLLLLSRPGLVAPLLYSSSDIWFLALVLLAAAQIARDPSQATRPLIALALAGLLRPEAWALACAYLTFLVMRRAPARRLLKASALALAAPLTWTTLDWAWTGDALHSLRATRELGLALQRPHGLSAALDLLAHYVSAAIGTPVLWAALAGVIIVVALVPERAALPTLALVVGVAAFGILAAAGLPLVERYVVLPATALTFFAAAAALGFSALPAGPRRRAWTIGGTTLLAIGTIGLPAQVRQLSELRAQATGLRHHQLGLQAIAARLRATPHGCIVEVSSSLDVPAIELFADIPPRRIHPFSGAADRAPPRGSARVLDPSASRDPGLPALARSRDMILVGDHRGPCS